MRVAPKDLGSRVRVLELRESEDTPPRPSEISEKNVSTFFDIPFKIQSYAESMKKILGAVKDLPAN